MNRKKDIKKRLIEVDELFLSPIVSKLINGIMREGKKIKAKKIVYTAADLIEKDISIPFLQVLTKAVSLTGAGPSLETRLRRLGGTKQQIPIKVQEKRSISLAIRWIIASSKNKENKSSKSIEESLAKEIKNAYNGIGEACKIKASIENRAISNMAFSNIGNIKKRTKK